MWRTKKVTDKTVRLQARAAARFVRLRAGWIFTHDYTIENVEYPAKLMDIDLSKVTEG